MNCSVPFRKLFSDGMIDKINIIILVNRNTKYICLMAISGQCPTEYNLHRKYGFEIEKLQK